MTDNPNPVVPDLPRPHLSAPGFFSRTDYPSGNDRNGRDHAMERRLSLCCEIIETANDSRRFQRRP